MRLISLLLVVSLSVACGGGMVSGSGDPRHGFAFSPPGITSMTPNTSPANSPTFTMTIQGSNFGTDAIAFWDGTQQQTKFVSSSQLLVTITNADLTIAGLVHVFVRTAGMNSNTVDFDVTPQ